MELSIEKQNEIIKQVSEHFQAFKTEKGLVESIGREINTEELILKLQNAKDFGQVCQISIPYGNDEELEEIKSKLHYEVQKIQKDIIDNYNH